MAGFDGEKTLLPFAIQRFSLIRRPRSKRFWAHARRRVLPEFPDKLVGDLWLMDETGELIAECLGLEGRAATADLVLRSREKELSQWFYQLAWIAGAEQQASNPKKAENWLIFMDDAGYGTELAKRLRADGHHVIGVVPGTDFERVGAESYRINPLHSADMERLWQTACDTKSRTIESSILGPQRQAWDAASLEASIAPLCAGSPSCSGDQSR